MTTSDPITFDEETVATGPATFDDSDPLDDAGKQAAEKAGEIAGRATDIGFQQADKGRDMAAEGITHVADSIRRVSRDMETNQPKISNLADNAAEQAERLAAYLRDNDARQMINNVEDMARRQPLLFLGGAFVLGVATARLFKAGTSTPKPTGYRSYSATGSRSRNGLEDYSSEVR